MVSILALWMPIVLSAVLVFAVSSLIHMVFSYHRSDFSAVPSESEVMDSLRPFNIPPGDYVIPHSSSQKEMESQEFKDKANNGPVAFMTVLPNGVPGMGRSLAEWFGYCVIVGIFAAYTGSRKCSEKTNLRRA